METNAYLLHQVVKAMCMLAYESSKTTTKFEDAPIGDVAGLTDCFEDLLRIAEDIEKKAGPREPIVNYLPTMKAALKNRIQEILENGLSALTR